MWPDVWVKSCLSFAKVSQKYMLMLWDTLVAQFGQKVKWQWLLKLHNLIKNNNDSQKHTKCWQISQPIHTADYVLLRLLLLLKAVRTLTAFAASVTSVKTPTWGTVVVAVAIVVVVVDGGCNKISGNNNCSNSWPVRIEWSRLGCTALASLRQKPLKYF